MATAKNTSETTTAKRVRCLTLAAAAHMGAHSATCVAVHLDYRGQLASVTLAVGSRSQADTAHAVTYDALTDLASCDCTAAQYGRACCHAGAAILYGRIAADCYTPIAAAVARHESDNDNDLSYVY